MQGGCCKSNIPPPPPSAVESACLIKDYEKKGFTISHEDADYEIDLVGTGDPMQCAKEMDFLFRPNYDCFTRPCSFAGIYQPPFDDQKKFYGTSVGCGWLAEPWAYSIVGERASADK